MTNPRTRQEVADLEWRIERAKAERVACRSPGCGAEVGEHCRNPRTGEEIAAPAHWQRITDAKQGERS